MHKKTNRDRVQILQSAVAHRVATRSLFVFSGAYEGLHLVNGSGTPSMPGVARNTFSICGTSTSARSRGAWTTPSSPSNPSSFCLLFLWRVVVILHRDLSSYDKERTLSSHSCWRCSCNSTRSHLVNSFALLKQRTLGPLCCRWSFLKTSSNRQGRRPLQWTRMTVVDTATAWTLTQSGCQIISLRCRRQIAPT